MKSITLLLIVLFFTTNTLSQSGKRKQVKVPEIVYVDKSSENPAFYHLTEDCDNCRKPWPMSYATALQSGLLLCSVCELSRGKIERRPQTKKERIYGVGDYSDVISGMSKSRVEELLGYGDTQSRSTVGDNNYEQVYYRLKSDFSGVIIIMYINGKVYSKQEITR